MRRLLLLCALLAVASARAQTGALKAQTGALQAQTGALKAEGPFTPDQRREVVQILRDALTSDPSILRDAVTALQAAEQARSEAETKSAMKQKSQELLGNATDPVLGNPVGDVTLVEFYDPRCQYCRRMLPAIDALLARDHGLRLITKDIPVLGPPSIMESRAILAAARQGAYGRMQGALMRNPGAPSETMIADTARALGLDPQKLKADMASAETTAKIEANLALARALHVEGTPVFLVGETILPGAVDPGVLDDAIAKARHHS